MRNTSFYDQEIEQVNQLVQKLYRGSPHTLDKEEFTGAVWLAYWEARTTYHLFEGCCDWDAYLQTRLDETVETLRCERNRRMSIESRFSLNQPVGQSQKPAVDVLFPMHGDYTRGTDFWDYMERLGDAKYNMVRGFCRRDSDREIMAHLHLEPPEFYRLKKELQTDVQAYLYI